MNKIYEILEFGDGFNTYTKLPSGEFTINLQHMYKEEDLIKGFGSSGTKDVFVSKVKRLYDSKILELGDPVRTSIKRFTVKPNGDIEINT
jgi:hypothetical protein